MNELEAILAYTLTPIIVGSLVMLAGGVVYRYVSAPEVASWSKALSVWALGMVGMWLAGGLL